MKQKNLCNSVPILLKENKHLIKHQSAKIILSTCTSHRQNFNAIACFLFALLGHQWLLLYLFLYLCVVLQALIKVEQTTETPDFQEILLNTRPSFS